MNRIICVFFTGLGMGICAAWAGAAALFLNIPSIEGQDAAPGYPDALAVQSVEFSSGEFTITRQVDSSSPALASDAADDRPLSDLTVAVYNGLAGESGPDVAFAYPGGVIASYQLGTGEPLLETITFDTHGVNDTVSPEQIYLYIPGLDGNSDLPGFSGAFNASSASLDANSFTVTRPVGAGSPVLEEDALTEKLHPEADLLFYNSDDIGPDGTPITAPDNVIQFNNAISSSYDLVGTNGVPIEEVSYQFASLAPEPGMGAVVWLIVFHVLTRCSGRKPEWLERA